MFSREPLASANRRARQRLAAKKWFHNRQAPIFGAEMPEKSWRRIFGAGQFDGCETTSNPPSWEPKVGRVQTVQAFMDTDVYFGSPLTSPPLPVALTLTTRCPSMTHCVGLPAHLDRLPFAALNANRPRWARTNSVHTHRGLRL